MAWSVAGAVPWSFKPCSKGQGDKGEDPTRLFGQLAAVGFKGCRPRRFMGCVSLGVHVGVDRAGGLQVGFGRTHVGLVLWAGLAIWLAVVCFSIVSVAGFFHQLSAGFSGPCGRPLFHQLSGWCFTARRLFVHVAAHGRAPMIAVFKAADKYVKIACG